ncbi:MAG TPA: hypothetical protein VM262_00460 [Acidimicrobiales bacterium]|nr:hypothetical protein [Acidimicrobiales bacterium]
MSRPRVVVLGMMTKMPVAGVVWQTAHYLLGLERLGCDAFYVEAHGINPSAFCRSADDPGTDAAAGFIGRTLERFGLADRWAFQALHDDGRAVGPVADSLDDLYRSAAVVVNLHGGTTPRPEHAAGGRLVYLETDPVQVQVELHEGRAETVDYLEPHCAFFTFGENYGRPGCNLPVDARFRFHPTRQPVVLDLWEREVPAGPTWTTIGNWRQSWRTVELDGEPYTWSKHTEWAKVLELPRRTRLPIELALAGFMARDRERLERRGFAVRPAVEVSADADRYRDYITASRGEVTVAKDQNVRLKTGWFSDRSATYLAAGRPVVTQDTAFGEVLPTGEGLFAYRTVEEAADALLEIERDWDRHAKAAAAIAREHFDSDLVLGRMLDDLGVQP